MQQYIGFKLDGSEYTIPILKVREIINTPAITRLPHAPDFMKGIINLRGKIVPVLDLRALVKSGAASTGLPVDEAGEKIIVVANPGNIFGMLVDSITSVVNIDASNIESPSGLMDLDSVEGVARLDDRLLILLDTDRLVASEEMDIIDRELRDIQKAADIRKLAAPPEQSAYQAQPVPPPAPKPPEQAQPVPPLAPKPLEQAQPEPPAGAEDLNSRVTVKDLHDASDMLSKNFDEGDSRAKSLADIVAVIDAMAKRDFKQADKLIKRVMLGAEGDLYHQIGHVTRKLHNSLKEFRQTLDPRIRRIADEEVPQAVDSLEYVIKKTEEAANRTLAVVEKHQLGLDEFEEQLKTLEVSDDFMVHLDKFRSSLRDDLNEIMLAQEFQDITGQTIRRVIDLVNAIEAELIGLIATFGVKQESSKEDLAKPTTEKMTQGDIEGLLKEFGF